MATPEEMEAKMIENLPEKTGKALKEWLDIAKKSALEKHGQLVKFLKSEHGVTHGYASLIAHRFLRQGKDQPLGEDLVDAQYTGAKAALRPIYDKLIEVVQQFGRDVEIAPKKSSVSLRRNKQFALITPATKTRVDLGINLKGKPPSGRLEASGTSMISHKVRLTDASQVDEQVIRWLKEAYEAC